MSKPVAVSNRAQAPIRLWSPTSECDWLCLLGEIRGIHISSFQTGNNTDISSLRRLPAPAEVTRGHAVAGQQDSISLRTSDSAVHGRQGPDQPPPQLQVVIAYLRVSDSTSVQEWVTPQSGTQLVPGRRDAASPVPSLCGGPASTASHTVTSTTDTQVNMAVAPDIMTCTPPTHDIAPGDQLSLEPSQPARNLTNYQNKQST